MGWDAATKGVTVEGEISQSSQLAYMGWDAATKGVIVEGEISQSSQ
jgi:hypothetical protein